MGGWAISERCGQTVGKDRTLGSLSPEIETPVFPAVQRCSPLRRQHIGVLSAAKPRASGATKLHAKTLTTKLATSRRISILWTLAHPGACDKQVIQIDRAGNSVSIGVARNPHRNAVPVTQKSNHDGMIFNAANADAVLNGHDHDYERFAPQDPSGNLDPRRGIREFVVGTWG